MYLTDGWLPYRDWHTCPPWAVRRNMCYWICRTFLSQMAPRPSSCLLPANMKGRFHERNPAFCSAKIFPDAALYSASRPLTQVWRLWHHQWRNAHLQSRVICSPNASLGAVALTLGKWSGWLPFYFTKVLYAFANILHECHFVFALMRDQQKVFMWWMSAFIFWYLETGKLFYQTYLSCHSRQWRR